MKFPQGFTVESSSSSRQPFVCKLQKSIYGLKQASRQWYAKLSSALCAKGFIHSLNDYSVFTKRSGESMVILAVYIDDIILTGNDVSEISALKSYLDEQFKIKDLGTLHYFLGIEVSPTPASLLLN